MNMQGKLNGIYRHISSTSTPKYMHQVCVYRISASLYVWWSHVVYTTLNAVIDEQVHKHFRRVFDYRSRAGHFQAAGSLYRRTLYIAFYVYIIIKSNHVKFACLVHSCCLLHRADCNKKLYKGRAIQMHIQWLRWTTINISNRTIGDGWRRLRWSWQSLTNSYFSNITSVLYIE